MIEKIPGQSEGFQGIRSGEVQARVNPRDNDMPRSFPDGTIETDLPVEFKGKTEKRRPAHSELDALRQQRDEMEGKRRQLQGQIRSAQGLIEKYTRLGKPGIVARLVHESDVLLQQDNELAEAVKIVEKKLAHDVIQSVP